MVDLENEKENLTLEQRLTILCSRITFYERDNEEIQLLKNEKLDWFIILNYCIKNKIVGLVWYNVLKLGLNQNVPERICDIFESYKYVTGLRNQRFIEEAHKIQNKLKEYGIKVIPLKGLVLIPYLYKNYEIRHVNDMDMMIDISSRKAVAEPLAEIGFVQGRPDRPNDRIINYTREELLSWYLHMNNMPLFIKQTDDFYARFMQIDFTFGIDENRENNAVSNMLEHTYFNNEIGFECLDSVDFFIHVCAHLYKEAINAVSILYFQDINLIKFCDVREYFLLNYTPDWFNKVVERAKEYNALKAIYYSLYYSFIVFNDYEYLNILEQIGIEDKNFLNEFGKHEWGEMKEWKKTFFQRLFSNSNIDEVADKPKITKI